MQCLNTKYISEKLTAFKFDINYQAVLYVDKNLNSFLKVEPHRDTLKLMANEVNAVKMN